MRARPTLYKGIRMRSRLEATFARVLDLDGVRWEYEPECFANEDGQYLPDFFIPGWPPDDGVYIEVKPNAKAVTGAMVSMDIIRATDVAPYRYRSLIVVIPAGTWPDVSFHVAAWRKPKDDWLTFSAAELCW